MKHASIAGLSGIGAFLTIVIAQAAAHAPVPLSAEKITQALSGKVCTTNAGAKFVFGPDGEYAYEGLWKNGGRYSVSAGAIIVVLDSGLERSFVISKKGDVFYIEQTAFSCSDIALIGTNQTSVIGK